MNKSTKVYILGAGCSVCGGYPLASDVARELGNFAKDRLSHQDATELKACVEQTCDLLQKHDVGTIDALVKILGDANPDAIKKAKIAISVFFFSLEQEAVRQAYGNFAALFDEMFRFGKNANPSLEARVKDTPCRVLTYNYDRLFERTFIEWATREEPGNKTIAEDTGKFLNMGLGDPITIEQEVFSLLKLHGGIGQFNRDGARDHQNTSHLTWPKFTESIPALNDDPYFKRKGYETNEPTIIFPHEKRDGGEPRRAGSATSFFQGYDTAIWKQANEFCKLATEVHIIGYSIQSIDYFWFKSLMRKVPQDARIILRNRITEKDRLIAKLQGIKEEFGVQWTIDYRAEDFFCIASS